jgi:hypothetical protein
MTERKQKSIPQETVVRKITSEMIEAGVCALEAAQGAFASDDLVVQVYSAMRRLEDL